MEQIANVLIEILKGLHQQECMYLEHEGLESGEEDSRISQLNNELLGMVDKLSDDLSLETILEAVETIKQYLEV